MAGGVISTDSSDGSDDLVVSVTIGPALSITIPDSSFTVDDMVPGDSITVTKDFTISGIEGRDISCQINGGGELYTNNDPQADGLPFDYYHVYIVWGTCGVGTAQLALSTSEMTSAAVPNESYVFPDVTITVTYSPLIIDSYT